MYSNRIREQETKLTWLGERSLRKSTSYYDYGESYEIRVLHAALYGKSYKSELSRFLC